MLRAVQRDLKGVGEAKVKYRMEEVSPKSLYLVGWQLRSGDAFLSLLPNPIFMGFQLACILQYKNCQVWMQMHSGPALGACEGCSWTGH